MGDTGALPQVFDLSSQSPPRISLAQLRPPATIMSAMFPKASALVATLFLACLLAAQTPSAKVKYGSNPSAGHTFTHDGVRLYYEIYGSGEPLLLVHGNGGDIADFGAQIEYFSQHYQVIAMDSRDQGKSGDSPDNITYEKMTDDLAALLDHLHSAPVKVLGWSDGGIEALLLGVRHPDKVKMIAAMAANLNPSEQAIYPEVWAAFTPLVEAMTPAERATPEGKRELKVMQMLFLEPHIPFDSLEKITAPTLILAADHDLIRDEHTLEIYHHVPNSQLCIFPNATHMIPYDDPALFDATVDRFFRTPFVKKDRIKDFFVSYEKFKAEQKTN